MWKPYQRPPVTRLLKILSVMNWNTLPRRCCRRGNMVASHGVEVRIIVSPLRRVQKNCGISRFIPLTSFGTVCWIEVKVVVLCARQYLPWNLLIITVLNKFWYLKHQILTRIFSETYLKHYWRNYNFLLLSETISSIMFQICFWASPSWNLVFEISKVIQNIDY